MSLKKRVKVNMSRPKKQGLDYFPRDINIYDDEKIIALLDRYGPSGFIIYDYSLTRIYRNGYYLEIPSLDQFGLFAVRAVGSRWITKEHVGNVLTYCGKTGLFRVDLLNVGVLTSAGIQRRYKVATSRRVFQNLKYWVLDEDGNELPEQGFLLQKQGFLSTITPRNKRILKYTIQK